MLMMLQISKTYPYTRFSFLDGLQPVFHTIFVLFFSFLFRLLAHVFDVFYVLLIWLAQLFMDLSENLESQNEVNDESLNDHRNNLVSESQASRELQQTSQSLNKKSQRVCQQQNRKDKSLSINLSLILKGRPKSVRLRKHKKKRAGCRMKVRILKVWNKKNVAMRVILSWISKYLQPND